MGQVIKIGHEPGRATHARGYWRNVNRRQRVVKMASVSPADIWRIHPNYLELYQQYFESDNSEEFSGFEEEFDILDKVAPDNRDFFLRIVFGRRLMMSSSGLMGLLRVRVIPRRTMALRIVSRILHDYMTGGG